MSDYNQPFYQYCKRQNWKRNAGLNDNSVIQTHDYRNYNISPAKLRQTHQSRKTVNFSSSGNKAVNFSSKGTTSAFDCIFELFGKAAKYSPSGGFGTALGIGFLVAPHIAMLPSAPVPSAEKVNQSIGQFSLSREHTVTFDTHALYYNCPKEGFSIVATHENRLDQFVIDPTKPFKLREEDELRVGEFGSFRGIVSQINSEQFAFTPSSRLLPGTPVFDQDWTLQGIITAVYHQCIVALRIDRIQAKLREAKGMLNHPEIRQIIGNMSIDTRVKLPDRVGDVRNLYWIKQNDMYAYNIDESAWRRINFEPIVGFNEQSRMVNIPDTSVLIVGGLEPKSGKSSYQIQQAYPLSGVVKQKPHMLFSREAPAAAYGDQKVYVVGGRPNNDTAEVFDLSDESWKLLPSPLYQRWNSSAIVLKEALYVVGGFPVEFVGRSIERYVFWRDAWEGVESTCPLPLANAGLIKSGDSTFLILGGRFSQNIYRADVSKAFILSQVKKHDETLETVWPPIISQDRGLVYVLKYNADHMPQVVILPFYDINKPGEIQRKRSMNLNKSVAYNPSSISQLDRRIQTPEYNRSYY